MSSDARANGFAGPRPRALIVLENYPFPGDSRVQHEAMSLRDAGWDVEVLAPHAWGARRRLDSETIDGIRIHHFHLRPAEESRLGHAREWSVAMLRIWRAIRRLTRERPFDVIQACNPPDFLLLAAAGQRRRGTRLIFDHHDLAPEMYACRPDGSSRLVHRALLALERLAFRLADVVLATNGSVRQVAIGRGGKSPDDVFVVRNGPDLALRPVPRDPALTRGRRHLLVYVGHMGPQDGVDHALRALSHLGQSRTDWHALFLGDGEMLPQLRELATELGLEDRVEFPGFVGRAEVRAAVSSADVCMAPDPPNRYTDASTLIKIAEYMALRRPIVSYDLTESRVTAGDAAVYAADNDPVDFARLIAELLDDPQRRNALGAEGRERVERAMAWEHSEKALVGAYERALSRDSRSLRLADSDP